jgi:hypothetical protein
VQSTLRYARANDTPDSYSTDKFRHARAAANSAATPNTSTLAYDFAAAYSVSAAMRVSS